MPLERVERTLRMVGFYLGFAGVAVAVLIVVAFQVAAWWVNRKALRSRRAPPPPADP